ncbi:transporter substrate-binding domain-containing protein [Georgenia sp. 10Sc9-8]|uniref:Transporter substrate-binding domain-containing protein n=1 Tax=Georgenia halotolerans TaxID=3028317 RepID=A0ABT5U1M9_9MICO|nr:transporter substrate-binding domain-containing protein [Georgenia halotolerans]
MVRRAAAGGLALLALVLGACSLTVPTDPGGTLDRVREGRLRVGVSVNEPWTAWPSDAEEPTGIEPDLVREFADHLDAEVTWTRGGEEALMRLLEAEELELVVGGLTATSPWADSASLSAVYTRSTGPHGEELGHVMATVLGENAFLVELEHFLRDQDVRR